ncbi:MAG: PASTA domain-containing protein [Lachnospiraceae bacterium]
MSIDFRTEQQYKEVFGDWKIGKKIGHGSQGKSVVYGIKKSNYTFEETGAVKVMNIMEQTGAYRHMPGPLKEEYEKKCREAEKRAETELRTMYQLKGNPHIVSCLDHQFRKWEDEDTYGEDLLIRMDLYQSIRKHQGKRNVYTEKEIVQIGKDICMALMDCHKKGILHRDIKPDNIFIDENGMYLLGDFGVARITQNTLTAETQTGSYPYAAPEQMGAFGIVEYDQKIDIYGLGLTLYELANHGCRPFAATEIENNDTALIFKRLSGEKLPKPKGVGKELCDVILKACEYKPQDRYQSAEEFYQALEAVSAKEASFLNLDETVLAQKNFREVRQPKKQKKTGQLMGIIMVLILLAGMAVYLSFPNKTKVPDFSTFSQEQAEKLAKEHALTISWEKEYSDQVKKGIVIKQNVKAGEMVKQNTTIKLVLSKGKKLVAVSDFTNMTWEEAVQEADKLHIKVTKKEEESATVEVGRVISQSVKVGKKVKKDSTVELAISVGQQPVSVPQLVGLYEADAIQACATCGLQYQKIDTYGEAEDAGKVIQQNIAAGEMVAKGTCIVVKVCVGAKETSDGKNTSKSNHTDSTVTPEPAPEPAPTPTSEPAPTSAPASEPEPAPVSEPDEASQPPEPVETIDPAESTKPADSVQETGNESV